MATAALEREASQLALPVGALAAEPPPRQAAEAIARIPGGAPAQRVGSHRVHVLRGARKPASGSFNSPRRMSFTACTGWLLDLHQPGFAFSTSLITSPASLNA